MFELGQILSICLLICMYLAAQVFSDYYATSNLTCNLSKTQKWPSSYSAATCSIRYLKTSDCFMWKCLRNTQSTASKELNDDYLKYYI